MFMAFRGLLLLLSLAVALPLHASRKDHSMFLPLDGKTGGQRSRTARLILDAMLQPQITSMPASKIANMSLSPWTYRESCDESRLPRHIFHAQCLTSGCLSAQGGGEDMALEAKPIYYQVLVLHKVHRWTNTTRGRKKHKYYLRLGTEVISVGCTCVRPSVIRQQ